MSTLWGERGLPHAEAKRKQDWCPRCKERAEVPDPTLPLTNPRHEKFCLNVAVQKMESSKAYMEAGFENKSLRSSGQHASTLKRRLDISNRISELLKLEGEHDRQTRESLVAKHMEVGNRCLQKIPVRDGAGNPIGVWKFDSTGANRAFELVGKLQNLFVERLEIGGIDAELHGKSETEVREMVEAQFNELGRSVCTQIMERVFGLKFNEGSGTGSDADHAATIQPVPTLQ